jgi:TolA-binding protein
MERYKGAITEFQKVIIRDERSDWAARSMYMQAVSFEELGTEEDKDAARVFYSEVVSLYPGSEHATQAKERLDALDR